MVKVSGALSRMRIKHTGVAGGVQRTMGEMEGRLKKYNEEMRKDQGKKAALWVENEARRRAGQSAIDMYAFEAEMHARVSAKEKVAIRRNMSAQKELSLIAANKIMEVIQAKLGSGLSKMGKRVTYLVALEMAKEMAQSDHASVLAQLGPDDIHQIFSKSHAFNDIIETLRSGGHPVTIEQKRAAYGEIDQLLEQIQQNQ